MKAILENESMKYNPEKYFYVQDSKLIIMPELKLGDIVEKFKENSGKTSISKDEDTRTDIIVKFNFNKKISNFTIPIKLEKLMDHLDFIRNEYKNKIKELNLKIFIKNEKKPKEIDMKEVKDQNDLKTKLIQQEINIDDLKSEIHYENSLIVGFKKETFEINFLYDESIAKMSILEKTKEMQNFINSIKFKNIISIKTVKRKENLIDEKCKLFEEKLREQLFMQNNQEDPNLDFTEYLSIFKDEFENIILKVIGEKFSFTEFGNYLPLYTYDNFKKLRENKTLETLKNKILENKEINQNNLEKLKDFIATLYDWRKNYIEKKICNKGNDDSDASMINNSTQSSTMTNIKEKTEKCYEEFLMVLLIYVKLKTMNEFDMAQNQCADIFPATSPLKVSDTISKVNFQMNKMGNESCWNLGRAFYYNKSIVDLDISICNITDENLEYLLKGLDTSTTSIVRLNLSNNPGITKKSGIVLANLIEKSPFLKHLNVSKNPIESGFHYIFLKLIELTKLNKSSLCELLAYAVKLDIYSINLLTTLIKLPKCSLKLLVLSENKFNNTHGKSFFKSMVHNFSIEELIFYKCDIDNYVADDIIFMLKNNKKLISVNFYENKITNPKKFTNILSLCQGKLDMIKKKSNDKNNSTTVTNLSFTNISTEKELTIKEISQNENLQRYNDLRKPEQNTIASNILRNIDLSKNRCRVDINDSFLNLMENIDLDMLDITQNIPTGVDSEKIQKLINIVLNSSDVKIIF